MREQSIWYGRRAEPCEFLRAYSFPAGAPEQLGCARRNEAVSQVLKARDVTITGLSGMKRVCRAETLLYTPLSELNSCRLDWLRPRRSLPIVTSTGFGIDAGRWT